MLENSVVKASHPKVSVCVVTYNQGKYIRQCLQSLVDQETDFDFEIIVSDDCSTDQTGTIVHEFAANFPKIVIPIFHRENIGAFRNFITTHNQARGMYICHVDGDDYALPGKLQKQVDFLDTNPKCEIIWHRMAILNEIDGNLYPQKFPSSLAKKYWGVDDLICNITIGLHSSKMYRKWDRSSIMHPPIDALDFSENILQLHTSGGFAAFSGNEVLGVYRIGIGISKKNAFIRSIIYQWLHFFILNSIGNKQLNSAKLLLMILSDMKHLVNSFWTGLRFLISVSANLSLSKIQECRRRFLPLSLDPPRNHP